MQQGCAVCAGAESGALGKCSAAAASRQAQRGSWVGLFRHKSGRPVAEGDHHQPGNAPKQTSAECCSGRMQIRYACMLTMAFEQKDMQWWASAVCIYKDMCSAGSLCAGSQVSDRLCANPVNGAGGRSGRSTAGHSSRAADARHPSAHKCASSIPPGSAGTDAYVLCHTSPFHSWCFPSCLPVGH